MKQKITVKVHMECDKCRNKALKIAAQVPGVSSVSIEGNDRDRVVVKGENVDTVCLGKLLKKKFRCVNILTVEEVKPEPPPKPKDDKCKGKDKDKDKDKDKGKDKGKDKDTACSKCHGDCKCHGQCTLPVPWRCYGQCPAWSPCPSCCVKRLPPCPPPCDPCAYRVVYDRYPDSCSIQ